MTKPHSESADHQRGVRSSILEVLMPGSTGVDVLRQFKRDSATAVAVRTKVNEHSF